MKKKLIILVLALAMVFSVVACGQSGSDTPGGNDSNTPSGNQSSGNQSSGNQSSGGDAKSEIKVGFYQFPNSLEPLSEDLVANFSIVYHVYDRLVRFDPDNNEWLPGIAESWERTAPNVWEFTCNLDYTFSNGDPLTMDDIVWSLLRLKDEPKQAESGLALAPAIAE